jgi:hypothetical protein
MRELVILVALCGSPVWAEAPAVMAPPALGTFFDPSAGIVRILSGVPGAAAADRAVAFDESFSDAFVNSRRRLAVAMVKSNRIAVLRWSVAGAASVVLDSPLTSLTDVAFSGESVSAAITDGSRVQVWSALDATPHLDYQCDVASLGASVRSVSLSSDGRTVAATLESGALVEITRDGFRRLPKSGSAAAFVSGTSDLLIVNSTGQLVRYGSDAANVIAEGVDQRSVLLATGNGRVVVAGRESGRIRLIDLASGTEQGIECGCRAVRLQPLDVDGSVYIAESDSGGWLLSTDEHGLALERLHSLPAEVLR